jgi:hypothetical protein
MRIRLSTDFITGLLFLAFGGFVIIYGSRYPLGTAARMGAGFYPALVSYALVLLGAILVIRSLFRPGEALEAFNPRPLFFVLVGTLAFALLVERSGFVLAAVILVFAARLADRDFRWGEVTILAGVLVAFIGALFWLGLSLPLKPFVF